MATGTTERERTRGRWLRRFGWLAAIWLASVAALALVAWVFRWLMGAVGLTAPS